MVMVTDPVCGMQIDDASAAATITYEGATYHFCSQACREQFEQDPARYTAAATD